MFKNNARCLIPSCGREQTLENRDEFYSLPRVYKTSRLLSGMRRARWIAAINKDELTQYERRYGKICSAHFKSGKPARWTDTESPDWVPSENLAGNNCSESLNFENISFQIPEEQKKGHVSPAKSDLPESSMKECASEMDHKYSKVEEDEYSYCRLCLKVYAFYFSLLEDETAEMLASLANIGVSSEDYSTNICSECLDDLEFAYSIQQRIIENIQLQKNLDIEKIQKNNIDEPDPNLKDNTASHQDYEINSDVQFEEGCTIYRDNGESVVNLQSESQFYEEEEDLDGIINDLNGTILTDDESENSEGNFPEENMSVENFEDHCEDTLDSTSDEAEAIQKEPDKDKPKNGEISNNGLGFKDIWDHWNDNTEENILCDVVFDEPVSCKICSKEIWFNDFDSHWNMHQAELVEPVSTPNESPSGKLIGTDYIYDVMLQKNIPVKCEVCRKEIKFEDVEDHWKMHTKLEESDVNNKTNSSNNEIVEDEILQEQFSSGTLFENDGICRKEIKVKDVEDHWKENLTNFEIVDDKMRKPEKKYLSGSELVNCEICSKEVKFQEAGNHWKTHHTEAKYEKTVINYNSANEVENVKITHVCGLCQSDFEDDFNYQIHIKVHHFLTLCKICQKQFAVCSIAEHRRTHLADVGVKDVKKSRQKKRCKRPIVKRSCKSNGTDSEISLPNGKRETKSVHYEIEKPVEFHLQNDDLVNCELCSKQIEVRDVENHWDNHLPEAKYEKKNITYQPKSNHNLIKNVTITHVCLLCSDEIEGESEYKKHVRMSHFTKICEICNERIVIENLNKHEHLFSKKKSVQNKLDQVQLPNGKCDKTVIEDDTILKKDGVDSSKVTQVCLTCDLELEDENEYYKHVRIHHTTKVCTLCSKVCNIGDYEEHQKTHEAEHSQSKDINKSILCDLCGQIFANHVIYKDHVLQVHPHVRKYVCNLCEKVFLQYTLKKQHERNVHSAEQHACDLCSSSFKARDYLRRHKRTKHGQRLGPLNPQKAKRAKKLKQSVART